MKPYLVEQPTLAFLIEWGGLVLVLALVFSPFFLLRLKRFKPTRWRHVLGAYAFSVFVFLLIEALGSFLDGWLNENTINSGWLTTPLVNITMKEWVFLYIFWPLTTIYSAHILYSELNLKRAVASIFLSLVLYIVLGLTFLYVFFINLAKLSNYL